MYGLFIGTTVSSIILFIFRIIPISTVGMIIILYLYSMVGGVTAYVIHKKLEINFHKFNSRTQSTDKKIKSGQELIDVSEYKQILDKIRNLKTTSLMLKNLIETRKKIEELKKESNSILEDTMKKLEVQTLDITKSYLDTK